LPLAVGELALLTASPLALSRLGLRADLAAGASGYLPPETQPFSLEIGATPLEFPYLVDLLVGLETP
jgi:hypothetical protein